MSNGDLYNSGNKEDKNAHVYCNRATSKNQSLLKILHVSTQFIMPNTPVALMWDNSTLEQSGNDLSFDIAHNTRVSANVAGDYLVSATITFIYWGGAKKLREIYLTNNAGDVLAFNNSTEASSSTPTSLNISTVVHLDVNDYIILYAFHDTSGTPLPLIDCNRLTVNKLV